MSYHNIILFLKHSIKYHSILCETLDIIRFANQPLKESNGYRIAAQEKI